MPFWIRALAFIAVYPAAIAGWIPGLIGITTPYHALPRAHEFGLILVAFGWAILIWCARDFASRGRGTPAPYDPPPLLVTGGLYQIVRNPMYVGVIAAIVGSAIWFWSARVLLYGLSFAIAFHLRVLLYEEPHLLTVYGADYAEYRRRVPRWIPRFP